MSNEEPNDEMQVEAESPQPEEGEGEEEEEEDEVEEEEEEEEGEGEEEEGEDMVAEDAEQEEQEEEDVPEEDPVEDSPQDDQEEMAGEEEPTPEEETKNVAEAASYSTRGRSADGRYDPLERLAREALGDLSQKEHTPVTTMRESFLSDSLTEEERRTRTRYLPEVDGMHSLRKHEIKGDLSLARSIVSATGATGTLKKRKAAVAGRSDDDEGGGSGEMDEYDGALANSEDDRMSESARPQGAKMIDLGWAELTLPSAAFVAPNPSEPKAEKTSPTQVASVSAFNPPRPPESIGAKKKHRMLRWERRPADIEVDLSNYRKTVARTRQELKNAEAEKARLLQVDNLLRRHFISHSHCLGQEMIQCSEELAALQQECVNAADLLTSRTRSRGAGKGSYAMRDVLHVLRTRGIAIESRGLKLLSDEVQQGRGNGGVGAASLKDWDRSTTFEPSKLARAWIVPGDKVKSPYGEGTVVASFAAGTLNPKAPPHKDLLQEGAAQDDDDDDDSDDMDVDSKEAKETLRHVVGPRVAVRLPFGIGFFPFDSVESLEVPATFSDARLAQRWKGIIQIAKDMGGVLDLEAMSDFASKDGDGATETGSGGAMDVDDGSKSGEEEEPQEKRRRLLPFGSDLLPTAHGRGSMLYTASLEELSQGLAPALDEGVANLGVLNNPGVPTAVQEREESEQEQLNLQAKVLQLRNELYRQRRIRMLNERTCAATRERAVRVESLVSEMRSDLKSLKSRLDEEIADLGISEDEAESILTEYYESLDTTHAGQASPPQRPRRQSRVQSFDDAEMEEEEVQRPQAAAVKQ